MKAKKAPAYSSFGSREKTFVGSLRANRVFRRDASRVIRIALVALMTEVSMPGLASSDLTSDVNVYQLVVSPRLSPLG